MIVKRCGKVTETGIGFGRTEMSYFLGVAYEQGATVKQDATLALRWLQRAGGMGSRSAQARLASAAVSALRG
jgi:TPR repeat protein